MEELESPIHVEWLDYPTPNQVIVHLQVHSSKRKIPYEQ